MVIKLVIYPPVFVQSPEYTNTTMMSAVRLAPLALNDHGNLAPLAMMMSSPTSSERSWQPRLY
eukprot:42701-Amorphochlora_amoeboformis.AAC.1